MLLGEEPENSRNIWIYVFFVDSLKLDHFQAISSTVQMSAMGIKHICKGLLLPKDLVKT